MKQFTLRVRRKRHKGRTLWVITSKQYKGLIIAEKGLPSALILVAYALARKKKG